MAHLDPSCARPSSEQLTFPPPDGPSPDEREDRCSICPLTSMVISCGELMRVFDLQMWGTFRPAGKWTSQGCPGGQSQERVWWETVTLLL